MKQRIILLEIDGDNTTKDEEFRILESIGNIVSSNPNRGMVHTWFDDEATAIDLSPEEWKDFSYFIASQSTHMIGSYPDDGWYHQCPFSTMDRAIEAFRVYQKIFTDKSYDFSQINALKDIDCSYEEPRYEEQENPEPDYDYEPEHRDEDFPEPNYDVESENTLTPEEEAELEESDRLFESLGLLD